MKPINKLPRARIISLAIYAAVVILSAVFILVGNQIASSNLGYLSENYGAEPFKAKVIEIVDDQRQMVIDFNGNQVPEGEIVFTAKMLSGAQEGEIVEAIQVYDQYSPIVVKAIEKNDKVILYSTEGFGYQSPYMLTEYVRSETIMILGLVFLGLLLLFGKTQGFNTIISLTFTCLAVFAVFIPAILSGFNIYFWAILICIYTIIMTLLIVSGNTLKTLTATIGCIGGVLIAGILTLIMDGFLQLTGVVNEESIFILNIIPNVPIDLKGIIFAGIIIGAMGAIMDVAMSIASSLYEMKRQTPTLTIKQLIASGFTISRDIMGTMANTLILAYIGSSLPCVLLLVSYNNHMLELFNKEMIVVEVLQSLVGSIGILATLPLTTVICAVLYHKRYSSKQDRIENSVSTAE